MPLHKTRPVARRPCGGSSSSMQSVSGQPSQPHPPSTTGDKSNPAAQMAQQLASQHSWADTYAPTTPAATATPTDSVDDDRTSQSDVNEPPPSYEDARLERARSSIPQAVQDQVRQESSSSPVHASSPGPPQDVEAGVTTPLLHRGSEGLKVRRQRQRRFIVVFIILAVWLIGIQFAKGFSVGFWRADGSLIPPLPHRDYARHETNASISGTFTFYDSLDLSTTTGGINIVIDPQSSENVGFINVASSTGSIKVKFSEEYMKRFTESGHLDRIYNITIRSTTGTQAIELPIGGGGSLTLSSHTGTIHAKLHMAASDDHTITKLSVQSTSGTQNIKIKPTSTHPITSLAGKLNAQKSASIKLHLPQVWEGMVHAASAGYGNVDVKGDSLQFQRNGTKEVYAWRTQSDESKQHGIHGQVIEIRGDSNGSIKVDCSA